VSELQGKEKISDLRPEQRNQL